MRWLRTSTIAVGALAAVGFVGLLVLRKPLIELAFGERYLPAADLLPILAVAMGWLAVVNVLVYFHIALASRAYLLSVAGVALETLLIAVFHDDAEQVALVVCVTAALVAFLQYQAAASIVRWQRPSVERSGALELEPTLDLSVVLPCHNAASGLRPVLNSLLERLEHAGSYEVIVVSDGSTDETVEIARVARAAGRAGDRVPAPSRQGPGAAARAHRGPRRVRGVLRRRRRHRRGRDRAVPHA